MTAYGKTPEYLLKEGRDAVADLDRAHVRRELARRLAKARKRLADVGSDEYQFLERYRRALIVFAQKTRLCDLRAPEPPKMLREAREADLRRLEVKIAHLDALDPKKPFRMSPAVYAYYMDGRR